MAVDRKEYNAAYYQANRTRMDAAVQARKSDPVKAARDRQLAAARSRKYREKDPERHRTYNTRKGWERLLRQHGLTPADYDRMLASQGGGCATCGTTRPWARSNRFAVDHDHATGAVRGLLCHKCNRAIGYADDDPNLLRAIAEYLERSR